MYVFGFVPGPLHNFSISHQSHSDSSLYSSWSSPISVPAPALHLQYMHFWHLQLIHYEHSQWCCWQIHLVQKRSSLTFHSLYPRIGTTGFASEQNVPNGCLVVATFYVFVVYILARCQRAHPVTLSRWHSSSLVTYVDRVFNSSAYVGCCHAFVRKFVSSCSSRLLWLTIRRQKLAIFIYNEQNWLKQSLESLKISDVISGDCSVSWILSHLINDTIQGVSVCQQEYFVSYSTV